MYGRFIALRQAVEKCRIRQSAIAFAAVVLSAGLFAQAAVADGMDKKKEKKTEAAGTWAGFGFGVGISADFDWGGKRVVDAELANNIVRVKDSTSNVNVGLVLEAHYFLVDEYLWPRTAVKAMVCKLTYCDTEVGFGPFVAVEAGTSTPGAAVKGPITAYALGLMVGLHHPKATTSWNFGIGLRIDPSTKVLGDGILANQPLPPGETAIRFKQEPRAGIMLLSSFAF